MSRPLYRKLTGDCSRFVRAEDLVYEAATAFPGLTPTAAEVRQEATQPVEGQGRSRDRPGHFALPYLRACRLRAPSLSCHAAAASGYARATGRAYRPRRIRLRRRGGVAPRPGLAGRDEASAFPQRARRHDPRRHRGGGRSRHSRPRNGSRGAARRPGRPSEAPTRVFVRDQPDAALSRRDFLSLLHQAYSRVRKQNAARARATRLPARRSHRLDHREAVDRGGRCLCHRRRLPAPSGHGLRAGGVRCLHDPAGAQGGDHSRRRQHAAAAFHRRPHRPPSDHVRAPPRL